MFNLFRNKNKDRYYGDVVDIVKVGVIKPNAFNDFTLSIQYNIYIHDTNIHVGKCDLRLGEDRSLYYAGNIGYNIAIEHRGHSYAYYACLLLFEIAKNEHQVKRLIITCSPDNIASRRTLEKLNGRLLEVTDVPEDHYLYQRGEKVKNIYEYLL